MTFDRSFAHWPFLLHWNGGDFLHLKVINQHELFGILQRKLAARDRNQFDVIYFNFSFLLTPLKVPLKLYSNLDWIREIKWKEFVSVCFYNELV